MSKDRLRNGLPQQGARRTRLITRRGQGATEMMHRRIFVDEVFIDVGSWQTGVQREGGISVRLDAQSEHIPGGRMHLKAAIGACGNDPDRVLRSVTPHVAIANPAFAPDSWRIQVDRVAGPARAPTKCSCITPMLDTHARAGGGSDHRYERSFLMMTKVINRHHQGRDSGDPNTIACEKHAVDKHL